MLSDLRARTAREQILRTGSVGISPERFRPHRDWVVTRRCRGDAPPGAFWALLAASYLTSHDRSMNRVFPFPVTVQDVGLLLLRVFAGLALALAHGWGKLPPSERFVAGVVEMGFPAAPVFAWAAGLSETVGGLLLAVGLLTRPAAFFVLATMMVAAFVRQAGDPFLEKELALLYGFVAAHFLVAGPGRLSLDALVRRAEPERSPATTALPARG